MEPNYIGVDLHKAIEDTRQTPSANAAEFGILPAVSVVKLGVLT